MLPSQDSRRMYRNFHFSAEWSGATPPAAGSPQGSAGGRWQTRSKVRGTRRKSPGCHLNWVTLETDFVAKRHRPLAGGNAPGSPGKQRAPRRGAGRPSNKRGFRRPAGAGFVFPGCPGASPASPPATGRWPFGPLMRTFIKDRRHLAAGEKAPPLPAAKSRRSLIGATQNGGNARFVFVQPYPVSITPKSPLFLCGPLDSLCASASNSRTFGTHSKGEM